MKTIGELAAQFNIWYYCRPTDNGNVVCYGPYEEKSGSQQHYIPGDAPGDFDVCRFRDNSSRNAELLKQSIKWFGCELNADPKVEVVGATAKPHGSYH